MWTRAKYLSPIKRPIVRYFGSKWELAPYYPAPIFPTVVEVSSGSGCYSLRHAKLGMTLWWNDLDRRLIDCFRWLRSASAKELLRLPTTEINDLHGVDLRELCLSRHAAQWIARWQRMGRNDCMTVSSWCGKSGLWEPGVVRSAIATLEWMRANLRRWRLTHRSFLDLPNIEATHFIDLPYENQGPSYKHNRINYCKARDFVMSRKGQVIVCERMGATWLPFKEFRRVNTSAGHRKNHECVEAIFVRGPQR